MEPVTKTSPMSSPSAASQRDGTRMIATNRRELATLFLIGGIAAVVILLYRDSFVAMAGVWRYSAYSHGVVVLPISAYLIWRLRAPLAAEEIRPWPWGVAIVAALVFLWLVSRAVGVQSVEHLAIVLLIPAMVATCLGLNVAWRALFPLLFLVTAVPIGDTLVPQLMRITADVASKLLRLLGVPVFRDGQFMTLSGGEFEVADVCSGLRYLSAGTTIALLFAYLTYSKIWKRAAFVVIAAVSLIAINGFRAFVVMLVASATNMRVFAGRDHIYFGWFLFAVLTAAGFWIGTRYADAPKAGSPAISSQRTGDSRTLPLVLVAALFMLLVTALPFQRSAVGVWVLLPAVALVLWLVMRESAFARAPGRTLDAWHNASPLRTAIVVGLAALVLVSGPIAVERALRASGDATISFEPPSPPACSAREPWDGDWQPNWEGADFHVAASYRCDSRPVNLFVAGYLENSQGKELINEESRPIPDEWRRFAVEDTSRFVGADGKSTTVNEIRIERTELPSLIWYWYAVGDRTATAPTAVKLMQGLQVVTAGHSDGAIYWLETPLDKRIGTSRERLTLIARSVSASGPVVHR